MGTGWVMQGFGLILFMGSCCFWSFSGRIMTPAQQPTERWTDYLTGDRRSAALVTLCVVTSVVGGIGLIAVGIGLHGERSSSGRFAMAVTGAMAVVYGVSGVWVMVDTGSYVAGAVAVSFSALSVVLFLLAGHSAAVLRKHPPPADMHDVTEEFLREYREKRSQRRNEFGD